MKLHEYQSKSIFSEYKIPIPKGRVTSNAFDAKQIAADLGERVIIKSQVLVGGRGKAGGIRLVKNHKQVEDIATQILGMDIKGLSVRKILIEEAINIDREIYIGITNDRGQQKPILMVSAEGGVEIEETAKNKPEKIIRTHINPFLGLQDFQIRNIAEAIDLPHNLWRHFIQISHGLWKVFNENDATLAEINPLVITDEQTLMALDGKIVIDDNALFRHPELSERRDNDVEDPVENEARKYGLSYIKLDGEIGCMVNGAGLAMATMDIIKHFGGSPANFLDIGGGASSEKVSVAFRTILADSDVKTILVNIFGGITRCDEVANGIMNAYRETNTDLPMIVRLVGTNSEEGNKILNDARVITAETLVEAAPKSNFFR
ncbi:MAG: ADP-forming succinate--CoA ligase subunit beta [Anaerolineaceae bacterium]|nr:ADP-forming succinate--CoA ligase subunit beta [Anaerolineaceae bacterium]